MQCKKGDIYFDVKILNPYAPSNRNIQLLGQLQEVEHSFNDGHVPHCHRQPIFIEQSEAILAGPREATHLPTWR